MPRRIRENQEIPRFGTVDRHAFVRDVARILLEEAGENDQPLVPQAEQLLCGLIHYLLGRLQDRPGEEPTRGPWRGKVPLVSLLHGLLTKQREVTGDSAQALRGWLDGLIAECEIGKYNPIAARAFASTGKVQPKQIVRTLDLCERVLRKEMGLAA